MLKRTFIILGLIFAVTLVASWYDYQVNGPAVIAKEEVCIDGAMHTVLTFRSGNQSKPIRNNPTGYGFKEACNEKS